MASTRVLLEDLRHLENHYLPSVIATIVNRHRSLDSPGFLFGLACLHFQDTRNGHTELPKDGGQQIGESGPNSFIHMSTVTVEVQLQEKRTRYC